MNININARGQVQPRQTFIKEYHDSKCHTHIHTVEVTIILACKRRTEQQATQGTVHPNVPPTELKCISVTLVCRLE